MGQCSARSSRRSSRAVVPLQPTARGFGCIDGIYEGPANITAVLLEPGFIDSAEHAGLWTAEGLQRIGRALAAGLLAAPA